MSKKLAVDDIKVGMTITVLDSISYPGYKGSPLLVVAKDLPFVRIARYDYGGKTNVMVIDTEATTFGTLSPDMYSEDDVPSLSEVIPGYLIFGHDRIKEVGVYGKSAITPEHVKVELAGWAKEEGLEVAFEIDCISPNFIHVTGFFNSDFSIGKVHEYKQETGWACWRDDVWLPVDCEGVSLVRALSYFKNLVQEYVAVEKAKQEPETINDILSILCKEMPGEHERAAGKCRIQPMGNTSGPWLIGPGCHNDWQVGLSGTHPPYEYEEALEALNKYKELYVEWKKQSQSKTKQEIWDELDGGWKEAHLKSVEKWIGVVKGTTVDDGGNNCALCQYLHSIKFGCCDENCPVGIYTRQPNCEGTPYGSWLYAAVTPRGGMTLQEESFPRAKEMLRFLAEFIPTTGAIQTLVDETLALEWPPSSLGGPETVQDAYNILEKEMPGEHTFIKQHGSIHPTRRAPQDCLSLSEWGVGDGHWVLERCPMAELLAKYKELYAEWKKKQNPTMDEICKMLREKYGDKIRLQTDVETFRFRVDVFRHEHSLASIWNYSDDVPGSRWYASPGVGVQGKAYNTFYSAFDRCCQLIDQPQLEPAWSTEKILMKCYEARPDLPWKRGAKRWSQEIISCGEEHPLICSSVTVSGDVRVYPSKRKHLDYATTQPAFDKFMELINEKHPLFWSAEEILERCEEVRPDLNWIRGTRGWTTAIVTATLGDYPAIVGSDEDDKKCRVYRKHNSGTGTGTGVEEFDTTQEGFDRFIELINEKHPQAIFGAKLLRPDWTSINQLPGGRVHYKVNEWQGVPGNGAYVAVEGSLTVGGVWSGDGGVVAIMKCKNEREDVDRPGGIRCFGTVKALLPNIHNLKEVSSALYEDILQYGFNLLPVTRDWLKRVIIEEKKTTQQNRVCDYGMEK